jgi:hypothetical protein
MREMAYKSGSTIQTLNELPDAYFDKVQEVLFAQTIFVYLPSA